MEHEVAVVRLMFAKKLSHLAWPFPKGFTTGSCTEDKHAALLAGFLNNVETVHGLSVFIDMGVEDPKKTVGTSTSGRGAAKDTVFDVDTSVFTIPSKCDGTFEQPFPVGPLIKLTARVSRSCPQTKNPGHFKDLKEGLEVGARITAAAADNLHDLCAAARSGL